MAMMFSVIPNEISDMNNASISIMGMGFAATTAVYFVDSSSSEKIFASSFKIINDGQINVVLPSMTPGRLQVFVVTGVTEADVGGLGGPVNYLYYVGQRESELGHERGTIKTNDC